MPDVRSSLDPVDYRYIKVNPDPAFSPERNRAIVKQTIQETDTFLKKMHEIYDDAYGERKDVLSSYAVYRFNRGTKKIEDYLGKKLYDSLIGEKILSKLRVADTMNRLNGNTKFKKGILL